MIPSDFNLVLNSINRTGYFAPNTNDEILFEKLISNFDLTDSYRYFYPYTKIFSFSPSRPTTRLDCIYISSSLIPKISNTSYFSISFSDHNKAPIIILKVPRTTIFKSSHWKLNDFIISFPLIDLFLESFIKTLSSPNPIQQPLKWWDFFKTIIKHRIIFYSKSQQSKTRRLQNTLNKRPHQAQLLQQHEQITNITLQLQQIDQNKQKGS